MTTAQKPLHSKQRHLARVPQASAPGQSAAAGMRQRTYHAFADLIYRQSGITLGANKEALMHARIRKRMVGNALSSFEDYLEFVNRDASGNELVALIDAISTNVTHFFREQRHFKLLEELVRQWADGGSKHLRIWSAACSTGEEPYSIAITLSETLQDLRDVKILATDISTGVVRRARDGIYEKRLMDKIPTPLIHKYFRKDNQNYRVADGLRRMVTFGRINLAAPPYPLRGPLDVIFCRNVMIYFDNEVRRRLLDAMYCLLRPGGYLMVGHAESLSGMLSSFRSVEPSVYTK